METVRKGLICLVLVAVAFQWSLIGERLIAVLWAWYKFSAPYSGWGHITVGVNAQVCPVIELPREPSHVLAAD